MVLILAFATMFIDHLGYLIYTDKEILRIIWRISFPLFAWGIVRGFNYTRDVKKYAFRMLLLAIITQIPIYIISLYSPSLTNNFINVCFTLLFWILSLYFIKNIYINKFVSYFIVLGLVSLSSILGFDYWAYWVLTIILFYLFNDKKVLILYFAILTFLFYWINYQNYTFHFSLQFYAIFSPIILLFTPITKLDFKLNRYFKYGFYPIHFVIIYALSFVLNK